MLTNKLGYMGTSSRSSRKKPARDHNSCPPFGHHPAGPLQKPGEHSPCVHSAIASPAVGGSLVVVEFFPPLHLYRRISRRSSKAQLKIVVQGASTYPGWLNLYGRCRPCRRQGPDSRNSPWANRLLECFVVQQKPKPGCGGGKETLPILVGGKAGIGTWDPL